MAITHFRIPRSSVAATDQIFDYPIPYTIKSEAPRVLFLFDDNPAVTTKPYLSDTKSKQLLNKAAEVAKTYYKVRNVFEQYSTMLLNYHAARSKTNDYTVLNDERVLKAIKAFKPDMIVTFGEAPWDFIKQHCVEGASSCHYAYMSGTAVPAKIGGRSVKVFPGLSLRRIVNPTSYGRKDRIGYLIGEVIRQLAGLSLGNGLGTVVYDEEKVKVHILDTVSKFDKFYDILITKPVVAMDTETDSLNKVKVSMQTLQMAWKKDQVFILPWNRPDCPFTAKERSYIQQKMKDYFEDLEEGPKREHVFVNANYDLNVIKVNMGITYWAADVWDCVGGETGLDENYAELKGVRHPTIHPMALAALSSRYSFFGYETNVIGKKHRIGVGLLPFDQPGVKNYLGYDVSVPLQIREIQLSIGERTGYTKYPKVVPKVIGEQIHMFSTMNQEGQLVDVEYLVALNEPNSVLNGEIRKTIEEILASPEVAEAEASLADDSGKPQTGFFGKIKAVAFDLSKRLHLETLFLKVMNLEPLNEGSNGASFDKNFINHYKEEFPLLSKFSELGKRKKLRDAFVKAPIKKISSDPDSIESRRIRCDYSFFDVVTGRVSARNPNMQQIPSRGPLSKIIKRLYISRKGSLTFKVDYRAHEVRGLALVSKDKALGDLFRQAEKILVDYVKNPTEENKQKLKTYGDIHMVNAAYFFGVDINSQEAKDFRDAVKAVVFGLIYGRGPKSLAETIGKDIKVVEEIMAGFFKRFPAAAKWLKENIERGRKQFYVEAAHGRRRRLWAYLLPSDGQYDRTWKTKAGEVDRVADNSPIQGMGSDFGFKGARLLTERAFRQMRKLKLKRPPIRVQNMVHDALVNEVDYGYLRQAVKDIDWALVQGVQKRVARQLGVDFVLDLGIEFEIGPCESYLHKWDGSEKTLQTIFTKSIQWQKTVLGYKVDAVKVMNSIYEESEILIDVAGLAKETEKELSK